MSRKKTSQLFLFRVILLCALANDARDGEADLLTDWRCWQSRLFWLNQAKPLHLIPWIALESGCIIVNRIIRIFVEVILRRWDL